MAQDLQSSSGVVGGARDRNLEKNNNSATGVTASDMSSSLAQSTNIPMEGDDLSNISAKTPQSISRRYQGPPAGDTPGETEQQPNPPGSLINVFSHARPFDLRAQDGNLPLSSPFDDSQKSSNQAEETFGHNFTSNSDLDDDLPDTQVDPAGLKPELIDESGSPTQPNLSSHLAIIMNDKKIPPSSFSFEPHLSSVLNDDNLPETQVNSSVVPSFFEKDSRSPTESNLSSDLATFLNDKQHPTSSFRFESHLSRGLNDDSLPDTQVNLGIVSLLSENDFGSPTQPNTALTRDHDNDNSSFKPPYNTDLCSTSTSFATSALNIKDTSITQYFPSAKTPTIDPNILLAKSYTSSHGDQTLDALPVGSVSMDRLSFPDNNHLVSQRLEPLPTDSQLPDTLAEDVNDMNAGQNDPFNAGTSYIVSEEEDLPNTQISTPVCSSVQLKDVLSVVRGLEARADDDTQATQDMSSEATISGLPSSAEMQRRVTDLQSYSREDTPASIHSENSDLSVKGPLEEKSPLNKLICRERKRIAVSFNRPPSLTKAMKQWITKTNSLLDPFREDDDCWFHPAPPPPQPTTNGVLRSCGKLQKRFSWQDYRGKHSIILNYGIVSKIVNFKLTKQQADGFINKQWHLSHLCGNWTCLNPSHTTVEPGQMNISRNNCFSHRSGCKHEPKCLKEKKVSLGPDGRPINHQLSTEGAEMEGVVAKWDDWSLQSFDDGESSFLMEGQDDGEFAFDDDDEEEPSLEMDGGS